MMPGDDVLMMPASHRIEVYTGSGHRRRWSAEQKAQVVAESLLTSVREAADRYGVSRTQVFTWRRDAKRGASGEGFTPVVVEDIAHEPKHAASQAHGKLILKLDQAGWAAPL